ncbi:Polyketide cyclase / dehydrase and lipid transport [Polaromonas sp. YR568]|uniref:SRPBCC family protein n=1 Tax=Polaromonas sp. YR568 TaxID=1855301 RepID=UPI0008EBCB6B|nr:SRPBCC family protein [Polaromonas sp. YR568]SFU41592.1 Polyketide cyclase / dehydrase and lipid transport [Polaromonas sp. YR568]
MTTIYKEFTVEASLESAWDALRDFNAVHQRLAPGFVVDCKPGEGSRTVTFANGFVAHEVLMGIHEAAHRLSYTVVGGKASHHLASAQLFAEGEGRTRVVWITDVLPDALGDYIDGMMTQGAAVMQKALSAPPKNPA